MVLKSKFPQIKLRLATYERLETFRGKRETFSEAVDRLLTMLEKVGELRDVLEGQMAFRKVQQERLEQQPSDTSISTVGTGEGRMP